MKVPGFRLVLASHVGDRDGMSLELWREDGAWVAAVFEDDLTKDRTVTLFERDVPLEALEWLLQEAKDGL